MNVFPYKPGARRVKWRAIALIALPLISAPLLLLKPAARSADTEPAPAAEPSVSIVHARPAHWVRTLRLFGTLVAQDEIMIGSAQTDVRITHVLAEEGEHVSAGQLLAQLDDTQHQARLNEARSELDDAQGQLREQQADHVQAQRHYARLQALGAGPVSAQAIDEQKARAHTAQARVQAAQAQVERAQAAVTQRRDQLAQTRILAPQAGRLLQRHAQPGALVGAQPLFLLAAQDRLELEGELPAQELALLRPGMTARIPLHGQELNGAVRRVSARVDPYTRLGTVRIALPDSTPPTQVGQFVQAVLELPGRDVSVTVPAACLLIDTSGQASVMVINDRHQTVRRRVQTGERQGDDVEIHAGLKAGESVVAQAAAFLNEGQNVTTTAPRQP